LDNLRNWEQHRDYHALVSGIDSDVKLVMDKLDELGIAGDTVLIYTSDHGGMSGVDGVAYGQKRNPHDESARVPFLVRWPGMVPENIQLDTLFSSIDVFPTLANLAGLPRHLAAAGTPEASESLAYLETLPGEDLSNNILGLPGGPDPESVFLLHPSNMNNRGSRHEIIFRAVVTKEHTYAVTDEGEYALWDNSEDYQRTNLVRDEATLATRRQLWRLLDEWMDRTERRYLDNWFQNAVERELKAWNAEHGFGDNNTDRTVGKRAVFDLSVSKPGSLETR
ncbi:MAG: sulfatase-like hydrolase/transferase, partial [bacterium]|nr:sulfatase-like hydrolase/transferase [bacterium]